MKRTISLMLLGASLITACGGGGGGSGSGDEGEEATTETAIRSGTFIDSPVSGLPYSTPSRNGVTSSQGEFEYLPGETVTFFIGDIMLGQTTGQPLVTPVDLIPTASDFYHPHATNIILLLQTLDEDGDPSNNINILPAVVTAANGTVVDVQVDTDTFENDAVLNTFLQNFSPTNTALVDRTEALHHFQREMALLQGNIIYSIGGNVSGLDGLLQVGIDTREQLNLDSDGPFGFVALWVDGSAYDVDILVQPVDQNCVLFNGSGNINSANIADIQINCTDIINQYSVGGTVTGLPINSPGLSLSLNGGETIDLSSSTSFTFTTLIAEQNSYLIAIESVPPGYDCSISNQSSPSIQQNISDVMVSCTDIDISISGNISGLKDGETINVYINGGNEIAMGNGMFNFPDLTYLSDYFITAPQAFWPIDVYCRVTDDTHIQIASSVDTVEITCGVLLTELLSAPTPHPDWLECSQPIFLSCAFYPYSFRDCMIDNLAANNSNPDNSQWVIPQDVGVIDCFNRQGEDFRDVQKFKNVESLELGGNDFSATADLSFLDNLDRLQYVNLSPNSRFPPLEIQLEVLGLNEASCNLFINNLQVLYSDSYFGSSFSDVTNTISSVSGSCNFGGINIRTLEWGRRIKLRFMDEDFRNDESFGQSCSFSGMNGQISSELDLGFLGEVTVTQSQINCGL